MHDLDAEKSGQTAGHTSAGHPVGHPSVGHPSVGHVVSMPTLIGVFVTLVALTGLTVGAAHVDLGNLNLYVALAIAGIKATLVILYFMHLRYDRPFNAMVFVGCLGFVLLFIGGTLTDTGAMRPMLHTNQAEKVAHKPLGTPPPVDLSKP